MEDDHNNVLTCSVLLVCVDRFDDKRRASSLQCPKAKWSCRVGDRPDLVLLRALVCHFLVVTLALVHFLFFFRFFSFLVAFCFERDDREHADADVGSPLVQVL